MYKSIGNEVETRLIEWVHRDLQQDVVAEAVPDATPPGATYVACLPRPATNAKTGNRMQEKHRVIRAKNGWLSTSLSLFG